MAQYRVDITDNGLFVATTMGKEKSLSHQFTVYSTRHVCAIQQIKLKFNQKTTIRNIELSENGALAMIEATGVTYIYNVRDGLKITEVPFDRDVALSHYGNFFLVTGKKYIQKFNEHGQELRDFKMSSHASTESFEVLPGDEAFLLKNSRKQYFLYSMHRNTYVRKIYGSFHQIDPSAHTVSVVNYMGRNVMGYRYSYPEGKKQGRFASNKALKQYTREHRKAIGDSKAAPYKMPYRFASLSPNGNHLAVSVMNPAQETSLLLIDMDDARLLQEIVTDGTKEPIVQHTWSNDSVVVIKAQELGGQGVLASGRHVAVHLNHSFSFRPGEHKVGHRKQVKQVKVSPNERYAVLPTRDQGSKSLFLRAGAIRQQKSRVHNVTFTQFAPNSSFLLVDRRGQLGLVYTKDIEADMGDSDLPVHFFSDSCHFKPEEVLGEAAPPLAYDYPRFERIKHISQLTDTTNLDMTFKTFSFQDTTTEIQLQLLDKNGNYYTGAAEPEWRHIWCNLILQIAKKDPSQLDGFQITEMTREKPTTLAISVVLDYSGSMGEDRINALLNGLKRFFAAKYESDGVSIVKYDSRVLTEGPLSTDATRVEINLTQTPYDDLKGATALLDGIYQGTSNVQSEEEFDKRIVIVITDGNENASKLSKNQVILNAKEQGISVYTIGFGDFISEEYLKSISYNTEGSYYRIYHTSELKWIYQDIYNKVNNYYRIRYQDGDKGAHRVLLRLCLDNDTQDTLTLNYDNTPVDLSSIDPSSDVGFEVPFDESPVDPVGDKSLLTIEPIEDFTSITSLADDPGKRETPEDEPEEKSKAQTAFESLTLPHFEFVFDKTKITNDPAAEIQQVLKFMRKFPEVSLEVVGHTDNAGSHDYNMKLSEARAGKVVQLLVKRGADKSRLIPVGMGDTDPIDTNDSEEGRQKNRRVVFALIE